MVGGTLAVADLLGRDPLVPLHQERAWILLSDLEQQNSPLGNCRPRPGWLQHAHLIIEDPRADADPSNTGWQRDLSVSHNRLGDLAVAAGLAAARAAFTAS